MMASVVVPIAIVANAVAQSLLVIGDPTPELTLWFVVGSVVSGALWLGTYALITARSIAPRGVLAQIAANGGRFAAWTIGWVVVVGLALIPLGGVLGVLILLATPYLGIAAMSGESNALRADLVAIRRGPLAYLWRIIVFALLVLGFALASALNAFFVTGVVSAFVNCLVAGAILWLMTWSFARSYRVHEYRADS